MTVLGVIMWCHVTSSDPHSVVFAGFSAESLRARIMDGASTDD